MAAITDTQVARLEEMGGRRWTKEGKDRVYFGVESLGLEVERYRSGNVRSAELGGAGISNSEANRLLRCKAYVDVATGEAVVQNRGNAHDDTVDIIATHLKSIVVSTIG